MPRSAANARRFRDAKPLPEPAPTAKPKRKRSGSKNPDGDAAHGSPDTASPSAEPSSETT